MAVSSSANGVPQGQDLEVAQGQPVEATFFPFSPASWAPCFLPEFTILGPGADLPSSSTLSVGLAGAEIGLQEHPLPTVSIYPNL